MKPIDAAARALLERLDREPNDEKTTHDVWSALVALEQYAALAFAMEKAARRRSDRRASAEQYFRVGDLCRSYLRDADRAVQDFERAADLDPSHPKAWAAARQIYLKQRRYGRVAALMERELAATPGANERAAALRDLAQANGDEMDLSNKIAVAEQLAGTYPKDHEIPRTLAGLCRLRADAKGGTEADRRKAARIYAKLATTARGDERVRLAELSLEAWPGDETAYAVLEAALVASRRDADLLERKLAFVDANTTGEIARRTRRDLAEQYRSEGKHREAIEMLKPLVVRDPYLGRDLQDLYRESGRLIELDALLAEAQTYPDPGNQARVLRERADIARQRGDREKLIALSRDLLRIDPADASALAVVDEDCRARSAFTDLRDAYAAAARADEVPFDVRRRWTREVAVLSEEKLGDLAEAADAWQGVLLFDETDAEARAAVERVFGRANRYGDLAALLERRAERAPSVAEKKRLLWQVVELKRDRLNDLVSAAQVLERLAGVAPDDDAVAIALFDAKMWTGDVEGLTEKLLARAEEAPPRAVRWSQLARRYEQIADDEAALAAWRKVRTLDPTQSLAWQSESVLLEKLDRKDALYATLMEHAASAVAATERARMPLLVRAVKLAFELGDAEKAVAAAEQASEFAAENEEVSKLLVKAYAFAEGGKEAIEEKKIAEPPMVAAPAAGHVEAEAEAAPEAPPRPAKPDGVAEANEPGPVAPPPPEELSDNE